MVMIWISMIYVSDDKVLEKIKEKFEFALKVRYQSSSENLKTPFDKWMVGCQRSLLHPLVPAPAIKTQSPAPDRRLTPFSFPDVLKDPQQIIFIIHYNVRPEVELINQNNFRIYSFLNVKLWFIHNFFTIYTFLPLSFIINIFIFI